jgi:hypothetical protein
MCFADITANGEVAPFPAIRGAIIEAAVAPSNFPHFCRI